MGSHVFCLTSKSLALFQEMLLSKLNGMLKHSFILEFNFCLQKDQVCASHFHFSIKAVILGNICDPTSFKLCQQGI